MADGSPARLDVCTRPQLAAAHIELSLRALHQVSARIAGARNGEEALGLLSAAMLALEEALAILADQEETTT